MKDNKEQSSYISSNLLQNFAKNPYKSQCVYPIQYYRSVSKIEQCKQHNHQSFSMQNRMLSSQTSRRKLQTPLIQYQNRFEQIQQILMNQNYNLKQQNEYLTTEIRRITKKQKYMKQKLQEITQRSIQQDQYIGQLQTDLSQLKDFVQQNIRTLIVLLQSNSLNQLKNSLTDFIEGITDLLSLETIEAINFKEAHQPQQAKSVDQSIQKEIEELSDRLESLITQNNNSCRQPSVRRECIEIARQIKQLQNRKKTPRFQKQHSQTFYQKPRRKDSRNGIKNLSTREKTSRLSLKQHSVAKKQQTDDNFKYPKQIQSKVTYRRSGSKERRLKHTDSMGSMLNRR